MSRRFAALMSNRIYQSVHPLARHRVLRRALALSRSFFIVESSRSDAFPDKNASTVTNEKNTTTKRKETNDCISRNYKRLRNVQREQREQKHRHVHFLRRHGDR